jgi:hypothetical protein
MACDVSEDDCMLCSAEEAHHCTPSRFMDARETRRLVGAGR